MANTNYSDYLTVEEIIEEFVELLNQERKAPNTISAYVRDVRIFYSYLINYFLWGGEERRGRPILKSEDLYMITHKSTLLHLDRAVRDFEEYVKSDSSISPQTSNRRIISLRRYLTFLYDRRYIDADLTEGLHIQKIQGGNSRETKWISRDEVQRLIEAIPKLHKASTFSNIRNTAIILVLVNCGLRVAELCDLTIADVDLRKSMLTIRDSKGDKARKVPMGGSTSDVMAKWLGFRMGYHTKPSDYVFTTERSGKMTTRAVQHLTKSLSNTTGIGFSPHTIRHTFCKNLTDGGNSLSVVAELAGHEDVSTTRIYTEPSLDELKAIVAENEVPYEVSNGSN